MHLSRHLSLLGGALLLSLGNANALDIHTSTYDPANKAWTTSQYPIDFSSTSNVSVGNNMYRYSTWNSPNNTGVKFFDLSPYVPYGAQCIEVSWWNDYNPNSSTPDFTAYVNDGSGWKRLADDNNLTVTPKPYASESGSHLPAFRMSGQGYMGLGTWSSKVRISAWSSASNGGYAKMLVRHRHDLTQTQCETLGNWPVVRFNSTNWPTIIRY